MFNTTGNHNTASGSGALYQDPTGSNNTANGFEALYNNAGGSNNTAAGGEWAYHRKSRRPAGQGPGRGPQTGVAGGECFESWAGYPGGSHLFIASGRPSHRVDINTRIIDWVTRYTAD